MIACQPHRPAQGMAPNGLISSGCNFRQGAIQAKRTGAASRFYQPMSSAAYEFSLSVEPIVEAETDEIEVIMHGRAVQTSANMEHVVKIIAEGEV